MVTDIKFTSDGDIVLTTGDIVLTEATGQHQRDLMITRRGELKEAPAVGVALMDYIADNNPQQALREVRKAFIADGMRVDKVALDSGELVVAASYI